MLELDIPTIVFEILNFLALSALLYMLLFRPVMRRVRQRAEEKEALMRQTQEKLREAERLRSELETRLGEVEGQISEIVAEGQDRMDETRRKIIQSARQEAERILKEAHSEAQQVQQKAMRDHLDALLEAIKEVSGQVIRQTAPPETHDQLVQQLNDRIWQLGSKEMDQVESIRRSLGERSPTVFAETAQDLQPKQQQELMRTLSALIDRDVELELATNPDLILGLRVRVGDTVINNSVAAHLNEITDDARQRLEEKLNYA